MANLISIGHYLLIAWSQGCQEKVHSREEFGVWMGRLEQHVRGFKEGYFHRRSKHSLFT